MKPSAVILIVIAASSLQMQAQLTFSGNNDRVITVTPPSSTGLEAVYVVRNVSGLTVSYEGAASVKWSKFGTNGAAYAEELSTSQSITPDRADAGYVVEADGRQHYFWIVNHDNHPFAVTSFEVDAESSDCQRTALSFSGDAGKITYYSINGRGETLDRDFEVTYKTLEYDSDANVYRQIDKRESLTDIGRTVYVEAPLCDTGFNLSGDRFMKEWNCDVAVETPIMKAYTVSAETSAEQTTRDNDNEQTVTGAALGGSAPCEITFSAAVSDAASFMEWQLSRNSDFDPIDDRYNQTELNYTFRDQGTTYVRFFAANDDGQCEYYSPVYEVSVGESSLLCPNAFSPESTPGVNDEWKVSYKSIISFECHIFNRWGTEMCSFTDPALGWDGKYKGKYVPAGVYYYVIKARGADGRDYKLSGDINIIKSKSINNSGNYTE